MPNIRIDREVYGALQRNAEAFVDTPNSVLRRLLGLDPGEATSGGVGRTGQAELVGVTKEGGLADGEDISQPNTLDVGPRETDAASHNLRLSHHKVRRRGRKSRTRARKPQRKQSTRVPLGVLLREEEYAVPLLAALAENGGSAQMRDIVEAVGRKLADKLTAADRERTSSGVVRWQNRVQFVRLKLVEEGLLAKDSPRGVWSLTDSGRARLSNIAGQQKD